MARTFITNRRVQTELGLNRRVRWSSIMWQQPCSTECRDNFGICPSILWIAIFGYEVNQATKQDGGQYVQILTKRTQEQCTVLRYKCQSLAKCLQLNITDIDTIYLDDSVLQLNYSIIGTLSIVVDNSRNIRAYLNKACSNELFPVIFTVRTGSFKYVITRTNQLPFGLQYQSVKWSITSEVGRRSERGLPFPQARRQK